MTTQRSLRCRGDDIASSSDDKNCANNVVTSEDQDRAGIGIDREDSGEAMVDFSYPLYTYDSNNDWDPNNPYAGFVSSCGGILRIEHSDGNTNSNTDWDNQNAPWEQEQQQQDIDNDRSDESDDVSSISSRSDQDEESLDDNNKPFVLLSPANDGGSTPDDTQQDNQTLFATDSGIAYTQTKKSTAPKQPPSSSYDSIDQPPDYSATISYTTPCDSNTYDCMKGYAYDPWDDAKQQTQATTSTTNATTHIATARTDGLNEQDSQGEPSNIAVHQGSADKKKHQSLFGIAYDNQKWNTSTFETYGKFDSNYDSNNWNPDDPYGGVTTLSYEQNPYDSNEWNPDETFKGLSAADYDGSYPPSCGNNNTDLWKTEQGARTNPIEPEQRNGQGKDDRQAVTSQESISRNEPEKGKNASRTLDIDNKTPNTNDERIISCTVASFTQDVGLAIHSSVTEKQSNSTNTETRKKFDFAKFEQEIESTSAQPITREVIPQEETDINKWLGGNIVKDGEIVRPSETKINADRSSESDESSRRRKIRFAPQVTDLETGENNSRHDLGSSLASDDSHPTEINLHRRYDMEPVPENSVPESGALNFNTIVLHNRLNPSSVPEPVLSSSLQSSNFDGPFVVRKNGSNGSDSRRTKFSDEPIPKRASNSKRRLFWAITLGILGLLGVVVVITVILVSGSGGERGDEKNSNGPTWEGHPYEDEDGVSSLFRNPTTVRWNIQDRLVLASLNTTVMGHGSGNPVVHLSSDGSTLATATLDGTVRMYRWKNNTKKWHGEAILGFPSVQERADIESGRLAVGLSGNGRRLLLGSAAVGRVYTFDYHEENDAEKWRLHVQPIGENQHSDGTGASVSLSHDGNLIAIGAPFFDSRAVNCGQIRLFSHNGVAWQPETSVEGATLNDNVGDEIHLSGDGATLVSGTSVQNTENGFESGIVWAWGRPPLSSGDAEWELKGEPLLGLTDLDEFGYKTALSNSGHVLAVSSPGYSTGVVFVYEYSLANEAWEMRGSPIPAVGASQPGVCLSADGNVVVVATNSNIQIFQYQTARNAATSTATSPLEWVAVGSPLAHANEISGNKVACSGDGRVVAVGRGSHFDLSFTVTVLEAVEL